MRGCRQRRHRQIATTLKEPRQDHLRYLASTQAGQAALVGWDPGVAYTGYAPVNTWDQVKDPDRWQPLCLPLPASPG